MKSKVQERVLLELAWRPQDYFQLWDAVGTSVDCQVVALRKKGLLTTVGHHRRLGRRLPIYGLTPQGRQLVHEIRRTHIAAATAPM